MKNYISLLNTVTVRAPITDILALHVTIIQPIRDILTLHTTIIQPIGNAS